jgi:hypothetical protein
MEPNSNSTTLNNTTNLEDIISSDNKDLEFYLENIKLLFDNDKCFDLFELTKKVGMIQLILS